ncbi:Cyclophilin-like domain containing protein [Marine Group I thaumarchaeote SCGC RSA3]|uniref:Cyclophilin-like domain containing protein n=3 Tax=Marine Group I TaxID=905826 RepID=A0A081RP28_9ARCH|nr:Cyclophilin-like domain containing protein [Marine Group I thaumarchaeote SCGC AAA799-N04]KFM17128.1 Cyclophilin-like domain containing protein [Marine Group I thaumarchaeote SCGC RSA3]
MKHTVHVDVDSSKIILELDDSRSPKTVNEFVEKLPFTVDLNVWGDEIYSSKSPIIQPEENAKSPVELNDVAYWPTGKAICLFYGPTPIGEPEEITPASPVNIIGKVISPDKSILSVADGAKATFRKA